MTVIALLNQKGGVGKTTLAVHLATAYAQRGLRVLLVDVDPQASALAWSACRLQDPLFPVIGLATPKLPRELQHHLPNYDHIIIDGPPRVNDLARATLGAADLVLVPVTPSPYDVWAAKDIVAMIEEMSTIKENQKSGFVINRKIVNTAIGRDVAEALADHKLPVFDAAIASRVGFAESAASGLTVLETEPQSQASKEIWALADEVLAFAQAKEEAFA